MLADLGGLSSRENGKRKGISLHAWNQPGIIAAADCTRRGSEQSQG